MAGGWVLPGLGASSLRSNTSTNAPVDIYVSTNNGSDTIGVGTQTLPLKTLGFMEYILPDTINNPVNVHLDSGTFLLPDRGVFIRSRALNDLLRIYADDVWDPSVFSVLRTEPAAAGSGANVVNFVGPLVPNAFMGKTIEVFHAGVRQRKTIRDNTATAITPTCPFSPAVAPGDAARILQSNVVIAPPVSYGFRAEYVFCEDSFGWKEMFFDGAFVTFGIPLPPITPGLMLEGVSLSVPLTSFLFGNVPLFTYGIEGLGVPGGYFIQGSGLKWYSGTGVVGRFADEGWGVSGVGLVNASAHVGLVQDGFFVGNFVSNRSGIDLVNSPATILGGRMQSIATADINYDVEGGGFTIPFLFDGTGLGTPTINLLSPLATVTLRVAEVRGSIAVKNGAVMQIDPQTTGAGPMLCEGGAKVFCINGTPNFGGAGTDWSVPGSAAVNKTFFNAQGVSKLSPTDGSLIIRTFS
jgi:hypothetical protein